MDVIGYFAAGILGMVSLLVAVAGLVVAGLRWLMDRWD
jgi:hypothetical protein